MRFIHDSNFHHNDYLPSLMLAYPILNRGYGIVYSFKASSRTIGRYITDGHWDETHLCIRKKDNMPVLELGFEKIYNDIDTVFFILKDAKAKIYSGLLEVSDSKEFRERDKIPKYKNALIKFLADAKDIIMDTHYGRYYQGMYYSILGLSDKELFGIDIEHPDYKYKYNVVTGNDYPDRWWDQPKFYTNKKGYDIVTEALADSPSDVSKFWYDYIKEEQKFEAICRKKLSLISKKDHQSFVSSQEKLYII